jgi:cytidylate kinase
METNRVTMMRTEALIAIDGPAASGKSTLAEKLARQLGYLFFDTGVMYRTVTYAALQNLGKVDDEDAVSTLAEEIQIDVCPPSKPDGRKYDILMNGVDITWEIRSSVVEQNVSVVSTYSRVRTAMTQQQRRIGSRGDVVMVGRDIGTVVFPEAPLKIYLDASMEERAKRRHKEITERNEECSYQQILDAMLKRDFIDSTRKIAPLMPAVDAIVVNTDGLSIDEVLARVLQLTQ